MDKTPFQVSVNGQLQLDIQPDDALALDLIVEGKDLFHALHNGRSVHVEWLGADPQTRTYTFRIDGRKYQVHISDKYDRLIRQLGLSAGSSQKQNHIKAPMPGLVLNILVEKGQAVQKGDALIVLEAMKMENVIKAASDGVIKAIPAQKGAAVEKGQLLLELE
jgi:biotin carboxyl carrier protein